MCEGGMICSCNQDTLDQMGASSDNFINFHCERCRKFVHLHYTAEIDEDAIGRLCAPCEYKLTA